ncbi:hypothetical protein [Brevundimonas diminuta]|uniref:hypothetical protein n=1 Tax=Brevundimonas diminuta TaxID=293 RepID=UPI00320B6401
MTPELDFENGCRELSAPQIENQLEDAREALEEKLLQHSPTSHREAALLLDLALTNIEIGGRCDGLDIEAVRAVRVYLAQETS